jgi:plastocyanin
MKRENNQIALGSNFFLLGVLFMVVIFSLTISSSSPAYSQYYYQNSPSTPSTPQTPSPSTQAAPSTPSKTSTPPSAVPGGTIQVNIAVGAGSGGQTGPCAAAKNCFSPNSLNLKPGDIVTWKNADTVTHTLTSGNPSDAQTGVLFYKTISAGDSVSIIFNNPGTMNYFCKIHPWLIGQVIVGSATSKGAVPEFGPVASIILVFAIVSAIIVGSKNKVLPRL